MIAVALHVISTTSILGITAIAVRDLARSRRKISRET